MNTKNRSGAENGTAGQALYGASYQRNNPHRFPLCSQTLYIFLELCSRFFRRGVVPYTQTMTVVSSMCFSPLSFKSKIRRANALRILSVLTVPFSRRVRYTKGQKNPSERQGEP
ncbi:MAG: hypothetical protein LUG45_11725 [Clostridiales bacterium]|nr:hypothetical protein [Clostridiales bacterium]